jgi:hypothetical protein
MSHPTYHDVCRVQNRLVALTGLEQDEFEDLLPHFGLELKKRREKFTVEGDHRNRSSSEYANSSLPTDADKLLFVLMFMKHNLSQEIIATMFDMSQNKIHHYLYTLIPTLRDALSQSNDLPSRTKEAFKESLKAHSGPLFVTTV